MPALVGIDCGSTLTKAVVFDADGTERAVARRRIATLIPRPGHVERDMDAAWAAAAEAIAEALKRAGNPDVAAVAATAHGDGVYVLDRHARPLGPGILSLDSRAGEVVAGWDGATADTALALTGQRPHVSAPSALLAWMRRNEPGRFAGIGHVLACKDWLRYCLTGTIGTDRTEASTSFTDVRSQDFSRQALALYGLEALWPALPEVNHSATVIGHVTAEAAVRTGLSAGTPVAAGLHDVTASALGIGGQVAGGVDIVAGTYSINEVISDAPRTDPAWFCRNAIDPGQWNAMSISPASTANYDWFIDSLCATDRSAAEASGTSLHEALAREVEAALTRPSSILFHPYLYGAPWGTPTSGSFVGLHGWHDRGDLVRAVLEGIAFNHRAHVEALASGFAFGHARLTGGVSRNPLIVQMFADILGLPVTVTRTEEAAAWGAALCAGAAVGLYASPYADPRDLAAISRRYVPDPGRQAAYDARYKVYDRVARGMRQHWADLEALGSEARGG
jgi:L-xylulokinase